jgi:hypothetical protein
MLFTEKLKTIFDKDHYKEFEFFQLIDYLLRGEDPTNIRWVGKQNFVEFPFKEISIENAFYNDNIVGLKILTATK